jgi:hypothetical protein
VNERTPSTHVAPFWHGADAQSSIHEHTRSLVSVAGAVSAKSAPQAADTAEHTRSLVAVGALVSYVTPTEHVATDGHTRSLVAVGAADWYVFAGQLDTDAHTRSEVCDAADGWGSYCEPAVHVRQTVHVAPLSDEKVPGPQPQVGP